MEDQCALQLQLLSCNYLDILVRQLAAAFAEAKRQQAAEFPRRKVFKREQVFFHADRIANDQTLAGRHLSKPAVFRNPVRIREDLSIVKHEVAVVGESKTRKTKATAGAQAVRPASKNLLQMGVDERMFEHVTGAVGNESAIGNRVLARCVAGIWFLDISLFARALVFLRAQQLKQFPEVVFFPCLSQLVDLLQSVRFDLKFNGVLRGMFD